MNGVIQPFCNVTTQNGIPAIATQVAGNCYVPLQGQTGFNYSEVCVNQTDVTTGLGCVVTIFDNTNFLCGGPTDPYVAGFVASYGTGSAAIPYVQQDKLQFIQAEFPLVTAYTMTFAQLVATVIRPYIEVSIANVRNAGIYLQPDAPESLFACDLGYEVLGDYCCNSTTSFNGYCSQTDNYTNPYSVDALFQYYYSGACAGDATSDETVNFNRIDYPVSVFASPFAY